MIPDHIRGEKVMLNAMYKIKTTGFRDEALRRRIGDKVKGFFDKLFSNDKSD